jgi:hypothetical protein
MELMEAIWYDNGLCIIILEINGERTIMSDTAYVNIIGTLRHYKWNVWRGSQIWKNIWKYDGLLLTVFFYWTCVAIADSVVNLPFYCAADSIIIGSSCMWCIGCVSCGDCVYKWRREYNGQYQWALLFPDHYSALFTKRYWLTATKPSWCGIVLFHHYGRH